MMFLAGLIVGSLLGLSSGILVAAFHPTIPKKAAAYVERKSHEEVDRLIDKIRKRRGK